MQHNTCRQTTAPMRLENWPMAYSAQFFTTKPQWLTVVTRPLNVQMTKVGVRNLKSMIQRQPEKMFLLLTCATKWMKNNSLCPSVAPSDNTHPPLTACQNNSSSIAATLTQSRHIPKQPKSVSFCILWRGRHWRFYERRGNFNAF